MCDYLAECLRAAGYEPIRTNDGLTGWRALETQYPDLVVVDLDVPVISGFRLLHLLRRDENPTGRRIPIVVMAGYDMLEVMDVVVSTRPDAYLQKPFAVQRFLDSIAFLVERFGAPSLVRGAVITTVTAAADPSAPDSGHWESPQRSVRRR